MSAQRFENLQQVAGSWPSPIPPSALTTDSVALSEPHLDAYAAWWLESRPQDRGRNTLVRCPHGKAAADVPLRFGHATGAGGAARSPANSDNPVDVRTRVHEYGGASYALSDGIGVVAAGPESQLAAFEIPRDGSTPSGLLTPLTNEANVRYGNPLVDTTRGVVLAVREDHTAGGGSDRVVNTLVAVPLDGSAATDPTRIRTLVEGFDFVTSPALSVDGAALAVIVWDHPAMPWTGGELLVLPLDSDGAPGPAVSIAGGGDVAASSPVWSAQGDLIFLDDSSGWTNPYRLEGAAQAVAQGTLNEARLRALHRGDTDFGMPQWGLGPQVAAFVTEDYLVCVATEDGRRRLVALRSDNGQAEEWTGDFEPVGGLAARDGIVLIIAASATKPAAVMRLSSVDSSVRELRQSAPALMDEADISVAEAVEWDSHDADGAPARAYSFWYPPKNSAVHGGGTEGGGTEGGGTESGVPCPAIVHVHGGPTSARSAVFNALVQFWTTRGIGVLDVNYGGSTGYGRAYQDRLEGAWGIVDVADCVAGARHLVDTGRVDPERIAIAGGSAGGFTALAALADAAGAEVFSAALTRYGVTDLAALAQETHKFEMHYLDSLVGPYSEEAVTFKERSPLNRADSMRAPVLILQGAQDAVVPPAQAHALASALRERNQPVAIIEFPTEGHGFREKESIERSAAAELAFLGRVWGFTPADKLPPLEIANL